MNRVVITGLGVCTPLGKNTAEFSATLRAGKSAIGPISIIETEGLITKIGAQVLDFDPTTYFDDNKLPLYDRCTQLALVAAREAIAQSGLDFRAGLGARTVTIIGSGVGGQSTLDENYQRLYLHGRTRCHPLTIPKLMINAPCCHITMEHGITGPSFVVASACSSANHAIGVAFQMVRAGMVDAAVTGGTEAVFTFGTIRGWEALRVMAPDTCRPFSAGRKGMVLGEGAAVMVLETYENAKQRGAEIIAEIIGFGSTSDASDIVMPALDGASGAIAACLKDAQIAPEQVDYVNAHGTGTAANDITETKALHKVFGDHAKKLAVSSTKSMHGHTLGAAGAIELAATVAAMQGGFIPPTANFTGVDPQCDLDYVPNEARSGRIDVAISNSFAFGGHNAVVAVRRA
ncbi:MAG TPA: beta-ketoacyl-[acyl-carrier-protein] synthase family protein [Stellaceae bacterium]|jgi:nodulation protein E|nr:beta-ketoacyl-[acyl-carrier-protein] synthase family protein [Stellaceae bacterium]